MNDFIRQLLADTARANLERARINNARSVGGVIRSRIVRRNGKMVELDWRCSQCRNYYERCKLAKKSLESGICTKCREVSQS